MIIAFAKTSAAFCLGHKTVTRRSWNPTHRAKFHAGYIFDAWSNGPHRGGKFMGKGRITVTPYEEPMRDIPGSDYVAEGFEFMDALGIPVSKGLTARDLYRSWLTANATAKITVVRFEVLTVEGWALREFEPLRIRYTQLTAQAA